MVLHNMKAFYYNHNVNYNLQFLLALFAHLNQGTEISYLCTRSSYTRLDIESFGQYKGNNFNIWLYIAVYSRIRMKICISKKHEAVYRNCG